MRGLSECAISICRRPAAAARRPSSTIAQSRRSVQFVGSTRTAVAKARSAAAPPPVVPAPRLDAPAGVPTPRRRRAAARAASAKSPARAGRGRAGGRPPAAARRQVDRGHDEAAHRRPRWRLSAPSRERGAGPPVAGPVRAGRVRRSGWPSVVAIVTLVAVAVWIAWQSGGYFPPAFLAGGAVAFFVAAALLVVRPALAPVPARPLVVALAASSPWPCGWACRRPGRRCPPPRSRTPSAPSRTSPLLGLALLAAGRRVAAAGFPGWSWPRSWSSWAPAWAPACCPTCFVDRGATAAGRLPARLSAGLLQRLRRPRRHRRRPRARAQRGPARGRCRGRWRPRRRPLAVAVYLSLSRGAWMALAVGLVVLLLVGPRRLALLRTVLIVAAAAALVSRAAGLSRPSSTARGPGSSWARAAAILALAARADAVGALRLRSPPSR